MEIGVDLSVPLLAIGGLFFLGLGVDVLARHTPLPRVTLLILCGVLAGPAVFDLVPSEVSVLYEFIATVALTMVAFLLGGAFSLVQLRLHARDIVVITSAVVIVTAVVVGGGLAISGVELPLALILAGMATATDPAATHDVIRQSGPPTRFSDTLTGIVALDDAWGMIAFSALLVVAGALASNGAGVVLEEVAFEIVAAIGVGIAIGLPAALITGRLRAGEPTRIEALGVVFLCAGAAIWIGGSFLIAGMVAGAIVVNVARHHRRAFHEIENIEWPFMLMFFFLAGASLEAERLIAIGPIGAAFIALRFAGRVIGGWVGGHLARSPAATRRWIGAALLPQAGVAIGMAIVAGDHFPDVRDLIITIAVGSTVIFETIGPLFTRLAVRRAG